ncbi:unnamed protein product [Rotaria sp. Silwood2]|nr:unnamed protein product [Rotaria sp. Silwood2]
MSIYFFKYNGIQTTITQLRNLYPYRYTVVRIIYAGSYAMLGEWVHIQKEDIGSEILPEAQLSFHETTSLLVSYDKKGPASLFGSSYVPKFGFDEKILVLQSLRLPKRITIREHDENDYRFLIKVSEDIRQDQRIQALFSIMNDLYDDDTNCNQSNSAHITVQTYKGMIEWLDNTPPLKELIETSYTQAELDIISEGQHPRKLYQDYVTNVFQKAKPTVKSTSNTIIHYILGIGDRHQSNFLIDTTSGQVIGIDFDSALNAATIHLPVPELIPIRLT